MSAQGAGKLPQRIGVVGLGNMGAPIAANVASSGFPLVGYDVAGTAARLPASGRPATSIAELANTTDIVFVCVPDGPSSHDVCAELCASDGMRVKTIADLSTIGPTFARDIAETAFAAGATYVDAPVSGGVAGARSGHLSLMFSGPTAVFEELAPILASFSTNVFHVGTLPGQGQAMKLVNNLLSAAALAATSEALALGARFGLELSEMLNVLNVSSGRNTATADKFPNRVLTETFDAGFSSRLMSKDVQLFRAATTEVGMSAEVATAVGTIWQALASEMPDADCTEIWRFVSGAIGRRETDRIRAR